MKNSRNKDGWMIIKIDIKKTFDSISWGFIENMLHMYNTPSKLKDLILSCLKHIKYIPTINGKKTQAFRPSRGIRQGDPISPTFLF